MINEEYDNIAKLHYQINEPIILQLWESIVYEGIRELNPMSRFEIKNDLIKKLYKSLLDKKMSMVFGPSDENDSYKIDLGLFSVDLFKGFPYKITPKDINSSTYFLYKYKIANTINFLYRIGEAMKHASSDKNLENLIKIHAYTKSIFSIDLNDVSISDFSEEFKNLLNRFQECISILNDLEKNKK